MFERCGWRVVARDDFVAVRTDQYDGELNDELPLEMVGALRALAESYNPQRRRPAVRLGPGALPRQPTRRPPSWRRWPSPTATRTCDAGAE